MHDPFGALREKQFGVFYLFSSHFLNKSYSGLESKLVQRWYQLVQRWYQLIIALALGLGEGRCGAVVQKKMLDRLRFLNKFLKAELRWPKGSPIGAPYHYRKEKESNELIFSCWVIMGWVLLVGAYSTHDDGDSDGASLLAPLFDIEHVMVDWHLSKQGIHWPPRDYIAGSSLEVIEVAGILKLTSDQVLVFDWIAGSC